jgi:biofilm PGA synthesis N-glycosyltransferase PgaC
MKRLAITIVFTLIQLLIGFLIFHDTLLLLFITLLPAIISFVYLQTILTRQKESIDRSNNRIPFIFFGLIIISQLSVPIILIFYYSQPIGWIIYLIITSTAFTLSSLMTIFFIPLVFSGGLSQEKIKMKRSTYALTKPVSIIVPAYNEEHHIRSILNSLLENDYQNKEVIVVDDGSTDRTYSIASEYRRYFPNGRFSVVRKYHDDKSWSKSSAINYGTRFAKGDIVIIVDSDSIVERNTIKEVLREFQDSRVIGVAGDCIVSNRVNLLSKCQALEYVISINVFRRAFGVLGLILIVPGPLGAFRRKTFIERGLCDRNTRTEDFDVTLKLLKTGGIISEIPSKSYTPVPTTFKDLYRQRTRWNQGAFQTLLKHKDVMSNAKHGIIQVFLYPIKLLSLLVLPMFDIVLIGFTVQALLTDSFIFPLIWFSLFIYFYSIVAIVAVTSQKQKDWKLLLYTPFMSLIYRQFIDIVVIMSLFGILIQKCQNTINTKN